MTLPHDLELLLRYPMVLSRNHSAVEYYGYLRVDDNDYRIEFSIKDGKYNLKISDDLKPYKHQINPMIGKTYSSPVEFLDTLTSIIRNNPKNWEIADNTDLYRKVLREYSELRQFYINIYHSKLAKNLGKIEIVYKDEKNRKHPITVGINYVHPDSLFQITQCDLPEYQKRLVTKSESSLLTVYENFLAVVNYPQLQMLFGILDEIDKNCWVLDPEKPTRKDVHRRIMLDNQVSIIITFNSKDFRDLPQIKFLGPIDATKVYRDLFNKNYINYDPTGDIILELHNLLEIEHFPRQPKDILEEELLVGQGECCICFSKWLNNQLPEVVCNNRACNQNFHIDCLYQWLLSLNASKFYNEICGNCPNCEKTIHCPIPSTEM